MHNSMNNPLTRDFREKISKIKGLTDMVERALSDQAALLEVGLTKDLARCTEDQKEDVMEAYSLDDFELSTELPTLFRYSMLTASVAAFETYLIDTALAYASVNKVPIEIYDLKGKGIRRVQKYFQKIAELDFSANSLVWNNILRANDLRNCVVHADGYIHGDKRDLLEWIMKQPAIRLHGNTVRFELDFLRILSEWYEDFSVEFDRACSNAGLWKSEFPD